MAVGAGGRREHRSRELLSGAREPMLARPVLMHLLWAGEATGRTCPRRSARTAACRAASAGGGDDGARWPLAIGGRLVIDGEAIIVSSVDGAEVRGFTGDRRAGPVRADPGRDRSRRASGQRGVAVRVGAARRGRVERRAAAGGGGAAGASERGVVRLPVRAIRGAHRRVSREAGLIRSWTTLRERGWRRRRRSLAARCGSYTRSARS